MNRPSLTCLCAAILFLFACQSNNSDSSTSGGSNAVEAEHSSVTNPLLSKYTTFRLTTDLSVLTDNQQKMISILIDAAKVMDELFWFDAYGDQHALISDIQDQALKSFATINYGPWDRLDANAPFISGVAAKPLGANYYPADMTKEEFEAADIADKTSLYTYIRRDDAGKLISIPYHEMFPEKVKQVADLLLKAAELADNQGLQNYLTLRADALLTDDYQPSDMAWLDMKTNQIDVVIGPIENYEDQLFGYKAAHEAYVLVKDMEWSQRLAKYGAFLPDLQKGLPVDAKYKAESPGTDTELNAYCLLYTSDAADE